MNPLFKDMGVGVGLRPSHHSQFLKDKPSTVSWVEATSENFMPWTHQDFGKSFYKLSQIRKDYPVALHGVAMNLGSVDPLNMDYMAKLKKLVDEIEPFIVSDHISWTGVNGENLHDLLPMPYTEEALILFSEKLDKAQNFLGRRLLVENPSSYLEFKTSEMSEPEFIQALIKKSDCGLLLDINNVYVSSVNHGFDPIEYLKKIPSDKIGQIHLAGHSQMNGYLIDTHDAPVCEEVWDLYRFASEYFGFKSTMIERDGNIPDWIELEKEILRIGEIREKIKKSC